MCPNGYQWLGMATGFLCARKISVLSCAPIFINADVYAAGEAGGCFVIWHGVGELIDESLTSDAAWGRKTGHRRLKNPLGSDCLKATAVSLRVC
jgi:hypothetical protein